MGWIIGMQHKLRYKTGTDCLYNNLALEIDFAMQVTCSLEFKLRKENQLKRVLLASSFGGILCTMSFLFFSLTHELLWGSNKETKSFA